MRPNWSRTVEPWEDEEEDSDLDELDAPAPDGLSLARLKEHPHGVDLGALQERPVRLRFALQDADLYALRFVP